MGIMWWWSISGIMLVFSMLPRTPLANETPAKMTWRTYESHSARIRAKKDDPDFEEAWRHYDRELQFDGWLNYAKHYQMHLPGPSFLNSQAKTMKMMKIGVQSGGSVAMWKKLYGQALYYVGVDADDRSRQAEDTSKSIFVEIGSQKDRGFLESVCRKHGPFDVIIDSAGHGAEALQANIHVAWETKPPCINLATGVYVVEDLHVMRECSALPGASCREPYDISRIFGHVYELMHNEYPKPKTGLVSMSMYRQIAFFQLGQQEAERRVRKGSDFFANQERKYNKAYKGAEKVLP